MKKKEKVNQFRIIQRTERKYWKSLQRSTYYLVQRKNWFGFWVNIRSEKHRRLTQEQALQQFQEAVNECNTTFKIIKFNV